MRKLTRPVQKVNAHALGLDVHKVVIYYCLLDRAGDEVASGRVISDRRGLEKLGELVGDRCCHFALETSGYSFWVYDFLAERFGSEVVHMAQARKIRAIANSRQKSDENDAFWLAYLTHEGRLPETYVPDEAHRDLRTACRARIGAVRRRTTLVNRFRSLLAQAGDRIAGSLQTLQARERAHELAEAAQGSRGHALRDCLEEIDFLERRIQSWDGRIAEQVKALPAVAEIAREVPGVGPFDRFASAKRYGGYTGLAPTNRSSGGRLVHGGICREGSPYLRWALTQAVIGCMRLRRGPGLAVGDWVRRKQQRMQVKRKARCAAARKLAESIWRLFHYGECFDAARAFAA
jgi:transposase